MKIGIIGTNFVSDFFMEAQQFVDDIDVIAVCSGRKENALKFKEKYNIEYIYDNYIEMLDSGKIDAVYIATPNSKHYEMAINSLKRKIAVFCEKPLGVNISQVKEMIETAKEHNTYLHDGIVPLYTKNFQVLKETLKEIGQIRKVSFYMCQYSSRYDAYLRGENPTTFQNKYANGSTMDLGIYVLSDVLALFGKPNDIYATATLLDSNVDALGTIILKYDKFEVVLNHSKVHNTEIVSEICGEKGIIQIEKPSVIKSINLIKDNKKTLIREELGNHFSYQIKDFVENVKNNNKQSKLVNHDLTMLIHETLTKIRKLSNIVYQEDTILK